MDSASQAKILEDIEKRWTEALISERHRERAKLLVMLLHQVLDERGSAPDYHHANIRGKIASLTADLHRMTTNEAVVVARSVKIAGDALPDPMSGRGFHEPLANAEIAAIRIKFPPLMLRIQHNGGGAEKVNGSNGNGNGNRAHEPEPPEESEPEAEWRWMPCGGPAQGWVHKPRRGYLF